VTKNGKVLVCDIDGTIVEIKKNDDQDYSELKPIQSVVDKLIKLKNDGWTIVFNTSRNMRTYDENIELIKENMLPVLIEWLEKHKVPYDEIHIGKPWCGKNGFYVDDKTIRPKEFIELSNEEIFQLLENDRLD
jgi:capsule biosynthesis phosphatase